MKDVQIFHIKNEENLNELVDGVLSEVGYFSTYTSCQEEGSTHDSSAETSVLLALKGDLGAGKTTFTKKLAAKLGVKEHITSPTFTILKKYQIEYSPETLNSPQDQRSNFHPHSHSHSHSDSQIHIHFQNLIHIDAYRLAGGNDLKKLGFKKLLKESGNLICLEWPEIVEDILPAQYIELQFEHDPTDPFARKVTLSLKM